MSTFSVSSSWPSRHLQYIAYCLENDTFTAFLKSKIDSIRSQLYIEKPCNPTALTYQRVSAQASHITCPSLDIQSIRRDKHRSGALFRAYTRPLPSPGLCPEPAWLAGLFYGSPSPSTCRGLSWTSCWQASALWQKSHLSAVHTALRHPISMASSKKEGILGGRVGQKTTASRFYWDSMTENAFWGTADKELHVFGVCAEMYLSDVHVSNALGVFTNFLLQDFTPFYSCLFCMDLISAPE